MKPRIGRMIIAAAIAVSFILGVALGFVWHLFDGNSHLPILRDPQVVAWVAVGANLAVVFVALFVNIFHEYCKRARFEITCGMEPPWQITADLPGMPGLHLLYVRLRVQNVGLNPTEACEVRLETIEELRVRDDTLESRTVDHDPRPLKWIGRDCAPIALNPGTFDFVDLGAQNEDFRENLRLEFCERGNMDLNRVEHEVDTYRLRGSVYGKGAQPRSFTFLVTWDVEGTLTPIKIWED